MKKLLIVALFIGVSFIALGAQAEDKYVAGGFEASGHVMAGAGYQHHNNKAQSYFTFDGDYGYYAGAMGKYLGTVPAARTDHFAFFLDGVELDVAKSFGENIRLRADMNFARTNSSGFLYPAFVLEQAYATANIPLGNGIEFLIGRFNTPIGFEAADAAENDTISKSVLGTGLRPTNNTGMKIYYAFSDLVDLHFYVVNTLLQDTIVKRSDVPGVGLRLGFNWGEEGSESTFGFSPFFGPSSVYSNKHYLFGGDIDLNWWLTESFALGVEALFSRANSLSGSTYDTVHYLAGLLNLHYVFSDVWDGTLKYAFAKQYKTTNDPGASTAAGVLMANLTGQHQAVHQVALAGGYAIADGAKLKLEGRFDIVKPVKSSGIGTQYVMGGAMAFVYDF